MLTNFTKTTLAAIPLALLFVAAGEVDDSQAGNKQCRKNTTECCIQSRLEKFNRKKATRFDRQVCNARGDSLVQSFAPPQQGQDTPDGPDSPNNPDQPDTPDTEPVSDEPRGNDEPESPPADNPAPTPDKNDDRAGRPGFN